MANRASHGINALWINLLCNKYTGCRPDGTTIDGIPPFMVPGDLSTPNPAYFQRADDMINLAAERGMLVMLDPIETGGWLGTLVTNGAAKARAFGEFLGSRYRGRGNIVWLHGNDLQTWRNPVDDAVVQAVAQGIASTDPGHIHTIELDFLTSGSLDDPTWAPLVGLDAAYTYEPTYAQVLKEYNRPAAVPVFMVEANYELERNPHTDGGSTQNLRRQEYWTMLSGATGQLYGNGLIWPFAKGWQEHLDSPGIIQLDHMRRLFGSYKWYDLVPDQDHTVVTSGYGTFWPRSYTLRLAAFWEAWFGPHGRSLWRRLTEALPSMFDSVATDTYATAARTADGTLVMAYLPTIRSVTVDMSKLARPATTRWFDPSDGSFTAISDSPIANAGVREFAPPGPNRDGDGDWVLVLECR